MSAHVLVTGGAGYIGSILVPDLLAKGYRVTVLDNFMYGQNSIANVAYHPKFSVCNGDVRDSRLMAELVAKADVIIPLAALVGAPLCAKDPVAATTTNRDAVFSLLKQVSKSQWIVMPTTNSSYGTSPGNSYLTEDSPLNPVSLYARDKVEVEKAILEHDNSVSFRFATIFGMSPRMRIDLLVNDFTYRAVRDRFVVLFEGGFKRNYLHVRDASRAFQFALENFSKMKGEIYNVGLSEANLTKAELCGVIQKHVPGFVYFDAPVGEDPDKRNYLISNAKIEKCGFSTEYNLDHGVQELIKGYAMIKNTRYGNF